MKYNWVLMKQDYIIGDIILLKDFFKKFYGKYAPNDETISRNTKGWKEERDKYQLELSKRMNELVLEKQTKLHLQHVEKMLETKDKLIDLVKEYFSEGNAYEYVPYVDPVTGESKKRVKLLISSAEFKNMWQIIKAEIGEPTNIPAEPKESKGKLTIPKDGVFGLKQLMVRWKQENGKVKQLEGEVLEGEAVDITNSEREEKEEDDTTTA